LKGVQLLKQNLLEKRRLSYSQITTFSTCPLRYKFRYIDNIPVKPSKFLSFGDSIHKAIEKFQKLVMKTETILQSKSHQEILLDLLNQYWKYEGYESQEEEQKWKRKAEKALLNYFLPWFEAQYNSAYKPLFIEEWFEIDFDSCILTGKIDRIDYRIESDKLLYRIIDFKTSERIPFKNISSEDTQLYLYTFGAEELLKKTSKLNKSVKEIVLEKIMFFYILPNNEIENSIELEYQNLVKSKIYHQIEVLLSALEREYFPPKTGNHCNWCDYIELCPVYGGAGENAVKSNGGQSEEDKLLKLAEEWLKLYREITSKEEQIVLKLKRLGRKEFTYNGYIFRLNEEKLDF
jgi:DNA helicase-2/ATP-dependent DNA helicase PcrA